MTVYDDLRAKVSQAEAEHLTTVEQRDAAVARGDTAVAENKVLADALKACQDAQTPVPAPEPTPESPLSALSPVPAANEGSLIHAFTFEGGDFTEVSGAAPAGVAKWSGGGGGGRVIGSGFVTPEAAHTGKFGWRAAVDPTDPQFGKENKASCERTAGMKGILEWWASCWYRVPRDYPGLRCNLHQMKMAGGPDGAKNPPIAVDLLMPSRGLALYSSITGGALWKSASGIFPLGPWTNITTHWILKTSGGLVEGWLDGKRLFSIKAQTLAVGFTHGYFGTGNYVTGSQATNPPKCFIDVDDAQVRAA